MMKLEACSSLTGPPQTIDLNGHGFLDHARGSSIAILKGSFSMAGLKNTPYQTRESQYQIGSLTCLLITHQTPESYQKLPASKAAPWVQRRAYNCMGSSPHGQKSMGIAPDRRTPKEPEPLPRFIVSRFGLKFPQAKLCCAYLSIFNLLSQSDQEFANLGRHISKHVPVRLQQQLILWHTLRN